MEPRVIYHEIKEIDINPRDNFVEVNVIKIEWFPNDPRAIYLLTCQVRVNGDKATPRYTTVINPSQYIPDCQAQRRGIAEFDKLINSHPVLGAALNVQPNER